MTWKTLEGCLQSRELAALVPHSTQVLITLPGTLQVCASEESVCACVVSRPDTCPDPRPCCGTTSEPAKPPSRPALLRFDHESPSPASVWLASALVPFFLVLGASGSLQYHPSPVVNATPGRRRGPWLNAKILRSTSTPIYPGRALTRFGPSPDPGPPLRVCWGGGAHTTQ